MAAAEAEAHEQEEEVDYEEDAAEEPRNGPRAESAGKRDGGSGGSREVDRKPISWKEWNSNEREDGEVVKVEPDDAKPLGPGTGKAARSAKGSAKEGSKRDKEPRPEKEGRPKALEQSGELGKRVRERAVPIYKKRELPKRVRPSPPRKSNHRSDASRRGLSPGPRRQPSPAPRRRSSPAPRRPPSPAPRRLTSPAPRRLPSPAHRRQPSPAPRRLPSPAPRRAPSPLPRRPPSPEPRRPPSPVPRRLPSPLPGRLSRGYESLYPPARQAERPGRREARSRSPDYGPPPFARPHSPPPFARLPPPDYLPFRRAEYPPLERLDPLRFDPELERLRELERRRILELQMMERERIERERMLAGAHPAERREPRPYPFAASEPLDNPYGPRYGSGDMRPLHWGYEGPDDRRSLAPRRASPPRYPPPRMPLDLIDDPWTAPARLADRATHSPRPRPSLPDPPQDHFGHAGSVPAGARPRTPPPQARDRSAANGEVGRGGNRPPEPAADKSKTSKDRSKPKAKEAREEGKDRKPSGDKKRGDKAEETARPGGKSGEGDSKKRHREEENKASGAAAEEAAKKPRSKDKPPAKKAAAADESKEGKRPKEAKTGKEEAASKEAKASKEERRSKEAKTPKEGEKAKSKDTKAHKSRDADKPRAKDGAEPPRRHERDPSKKEPGARKEGESATVRDSRSRPVEDTPGRSRRTDLGAVRDDGGSRRPPPPAAATFGEEPRRHAEGGGYPQPPPLREQPGVRGVHSEGVDERSRYGDPYLLERGRYVGSLGSSLGSQRVVPATLSGQEQVYEDHLLQTRREVEQARYPPPPTRSAIALGREYLETGQAVPAQVPAPPPPHLLDDDGIYGGAQAGSFPTRLRSGVIVGDSHLQMSTSSLNAAAPDPSRYRTAGRLSSTEMLDDDRRNEWYYMDPQGNVQGPASKAQLRIWLTQLANGDDRLRHQAFCRVNVWREGMRQQEGIQLLRLLQAV